MSKGLKRKNDESSTTKKVKQMTLTPSNGSAAGKGEFSKEVVSIVCWNVNGIRACIKKPGFLEFTSQENIDVLCFNETKIQDVHIKEVKNHFKQFPFQFWSCSHEKLGYSGTAILSKVEPVAWSEGLRGHPLEGRVTVAEFDSFFLVCTYVPNSGKERFGYRLNEWDPDLRRFLKDLESRGKPVVWVGDLNVINQDIDIFRLKGNEKHAGATPEERKSFHSTLESGFFDSFRALYPSEVKYSWYSAISKKSRSNNEGWRIDMAVLSESLRPRLVDSLIHDNVMGSDHHPIELKLRTVQSLSKSKD
jgi:exodeoxyribonuclease-3